MKKHLKSQESAQSEFSRRISADKLLNYNEATKLVIEEHISRTFRSEDRHLSESDFVLVCERLSNIIKYTPLVQRYESLYQSLSQRYHPFSLSDAEKVFTGAFNKYFSRQ